MAGELTHARLDHRRVWRLRPRLEGTVVVERAGRPSDRGPAGRADVLPARTTVRAPGDPPTNRDPGWRARGPRRLEANRPRGRRAEARPGDRAAALPRHPGSRAHPRLERRIRRPSAVQRRPALQPAICDRARHLPDGAPALRERRVAGGRGGLSPPFSPSRPPGNPPPPPPPPTRRAPPGGGPTPP